MAINRYHTHLYILPEDDATRSIANGFIDVTTGQIQPLRPAGGWGRVLEEFERTHAPELIKYPKGHIILLIDFDDDFENRIKKFKEKIPSDLEDRVYIFGARTEAETLKKESNKKFGELGQALGTECQTGIHSLWKLPQLQINHSECQRLLKNLGDSLF